MQDARRSALQAELVRARAVYRELPFAWQTGKRAIYGVIDLLYQREDGRWALVDYKTGRPPDLSADGLRAFVRPYHFQMAVYAAAARDVLALPDLDVYIHAIRARTSIPITRHELDEALRQLESTIGALSEEDAHG